MEFVDIVCSVVTGVDVSNCPSLFFVSVFYSELEYIYVDNCPEIRDIWLAYNRNLTSLDLSGVPLLWQLILPGNGLTSLDLSFCPELQILECDNNSLTSLDVSMLSNLQMLRCENQYWEMPNNNSFTSLDLSSNENLVEFTCYNTGVSELNVAGLTALSAINCGNCNLSTLDVTGCESIGILAFANNNISDIDTSGIVVPMMTFESSYNPMDQTAFENAVYPHGKELQFLHCAGNNLTSFDMSMFEFIDDLNLGSNNFSVLDISNVRRIDIQYMGDMERISIELTEYNYIFVDGSSPAEFLLVGDPSTLCYLSCNGCGLSSITEAVFESDTLWGLLCADNNLTGTLDLSMSASLSELDCSGNAIDSLILSEGSEFSQLIVKDTGISELHVENSYNGAPISLHAENGYVGLSLQGSSELVKVGDDIMEIKHADTVLWAAPAQGYEFAGWYDAQGGLVSSELEYKLEEGYEYDLTAAFVEAVEPTEEPTDEPVVTSEPTDEPVVTSEPTDEPVVTSKPTDEPVVTSEPSPEVPSTGFAGMALLGIAAVSAGIGITAYRRRED